VSWGQGNTKKKNVDLRLRVVGTYEDLVSGVPPLVWPLFWRRDLCAAGVDPVVAMRQQ
jgi:hypothetical protein